MLHQQISFLLSFFFHVSQFQIIMLQGPVSFPISFASSTCKKHHIRIHKFEFIYPSHASTIKNRTISLLVTPEPFPVNINFSGREKVGATGADPTLRKIFTPNIWVFHEYQICTPFTGSFTYYPFTHAPYHPAVVAVEDRRQSCQDGPQIAHAHQDMEARDW